MAKDDKDDGYKEGVDFEWVKAKNGNYKTRRFFSKAEKEERKKPKAEKKPETKKKAESKSAVRTSPRPVPRSRATFDIEVSKLPPLRDSEYKSSGRGDGRAEVIRRRGDAALARVAAGEGKKPEGREAFGVPVSNPNREMALERRRRDREERRKAESEGGRTSVLGRVIDRIFSDKDGDEKKKRDRRGRVVGMAKGGMVKANCGASMKPTQGKKK